MKNFSAILQTVWRPAQKNSWGGCINPPDRARVKFEHQSLSLVTSNTPAFFPQSYSSISGESAGGRSLPPCAVEGCEMTCADDC